MHHDGSIGLKISGLGVWVASFSAAAQGQDPKIEPAHVFVRAKLVQEELKLIRFVMGRPENKQAPIGVKEAEPREVYFQAVTLFRKANRLAFEHLRSRAKEPPLPKTALAPADVHHMVDAALVQIRAVKKKLGISDKAVEPALDDSKQPNDVFQAIVQANRQLNLLLDQRFTPSDVFQQVTRGVGYASRLLAQFPQATTIPKAPAFAVGKRPPDVYQRLVDCFQRLRDIADDSGVKMLKLEPDKQSIANAEPSDVYDVASLLVSELAYLHSQLKNAKPPRRVFYPGRKFPSHVFQRAGILEKQLIELEAAVDKNRAWLKSDPAP